jgi:hypothetical protein
MAMASVLRGMSVSFGIGRSLRSLASSASSGGGVIDLCMPSEEAISTHGRGERGMRGQLAWASTLHAPMHSHAMPHACGRAQWVSLESARWACRWPPTWSALASALLSVISQPRHYAGFKRPWGQPSGIACRSWGAPGRSQRRQMCLLSSLCCLPQTTCERHTRG